MGTLLLFAVAVVAIHALAVGRATAPLRLQGLRVVADAAAHDLAEGHPPHSHEPFGFSVVGPDGKLLEGERVPHRLHWHDPHAGPGEYCGPFSGPCYAVRALPGRADGARLLVFPRVPHELRVELAAPLSFVLIASVALWLSVSAVAGHVLLRSLRRADDSRRRLLAGLAHDLGTPLTSIRGFAETLLARQDGSAADRRGWTVVYREALRMQRMVEDLLTLTRLEAGKLSMVPRPFDLREALEAAAERARLAHGDTPRLELPDEPATAALDRDRIDQALANLVDNAYRHGEGRDVALALARAPGGQAWRIEVRDGGPGLTPQARARLFEPFQGEGGRGAGLGLAIAREIALRHGGRIEVSEGPGCRVTLELPAERA